MFRKSFVKKVLFKQRLEEWEGMSHSGFGGRDVPGKGNSKCKGPELGTCLCFQGTIKRSMWLEWRDQAPVVQGLGGQFKDLGLKEKDLGQEKGGAKERFSVEK